MTVGELANRFPGLVTSGISKHLMYLRAAGLVAVTRQGRRRLYRIDGEAMTAALGPWLAKYRPYLSAALDRLRALAENGGVDVDTEDSPDDDEDDGSGAGESQARTAD